jgi:hypothetical protein
VVDPKRDLGGGGGGGVSDEIGSTLLAWWNFARLGRIGGGGGGRV